MSKEIEIERKFVLKRLPHLIKGASIIGRAITQYYIEDEDEPEKTFRVRLTSYKNKNTYVRTIKTPIKNSDSIGQHEDETEITEFDFNQCVQHANKRITKVRYVITIEGNKWEFDCFRDLDLIMCELEMIAKTEDVVEEVEKKLFDVKVPDSIKEVLIKEVTGNRDYSNRSLAIKI